MLKLWLSVLLLFTTVLAEAQAPAPLSVRLKDLASLSAAAGYRLLGYGLVVGLDGTGDSDRTAFTQAALKNMLEQMGLRLPAGQLQVKNVAAVMVTAEMAPGAVRNARFDVLVSSVGDAASLQGGTLLATPLRGSDGVVRALAQGPLSIGGYGAGGGGSSQVNNHLSVGRVPQGGWITQSLAADLAPDQALTLTLYQPDFTTAGRLAEALNGQLGPGRARASDAGTVVLSLLAGEDPAALLARVEDLPVQPEAPARVVVNERTGTVVMGENVRILPVAVAHGGLTVRVRERVAVSQPPPLSGGSTVVVPEKKLSVEEAGGALWEVPPQGTLGDLVRALNALGVKPRDLIAIIQALKQAGALQAELIIM
ncbi:MAG TPA: flagellar basal body P-ring protein FlgI [Armatimonadota bacterium]|jgi:flagellar P-ring protein precursor FlgI